MNLPYLEFLSYCKLLETVPLGHCSGISSYTHSPSINQPFIASITFLHIYWDKKGFKVSSNIVSHKSWHSRASYIGIIHYCTVKAIRYNCIFYEEPIEASIV